MYEIERWIGVAVLGLLWLKFTGYNVFFAADRIHRRAHDGPSPLPVIGSICGIAALLLAPVGSLQLRLIFTPLALIPDLAMPLADKIVTRLGPREKPPAG
ncbi:MAG: hypothetical protein OEY16_10945 [Alphaproteobacteria bacterium]|nr:hypothetical protein [Alphaproteobacteria bacterium]